MATAGKMKSNLAPSMSDVPSEQISISQWMKNTFPNAVEIGIRLRIEQISAIDTVAQTYTFRLTEILDWKATDEDVEDYNKDPIGFSPSFSVSPPYLANAVHEEVFNQTFALRRGQDGEWYNVRITLKGCTATESFECSNFPFDVQDLSLCYSQDRASDQARFVPSHSHSQKEVMHINKTYLALSDWDIVSSDVSEQFVDFAQARTAEFPEDQKRRTDLDNYDGQSRPDVCHFYYFRIQVQRKAFGFVMRALLWMFLLSLSGFFIFAFEPQEVSDRLALTIGLIFAIIAFQFVISSQIPNLSYLTIVDKYNLAVFVFVLLLALESVIVGWRGGLFDDDDVAERVDYVFFAILAGIWLVFHALFAIYIRKERECESAKIGKPFHETHEKHALASCFAKDLYSIPWEGASNVK